MNPRTITNYQFDNNQYCELSESMFSEDNPGYKSRVVESPNGDGIWDTKKKYAHFAPKYFEKINKKKSYFKIWNYYTICMLVADAICRKLDIPQEYHPGYDSTLRILYYPEGAATAPHTDFDLFTICMYRDVKDTFRYLDGENDPLLVKARKLSPGIHFGELMTEINGAAPTKHEVAASSQEQNSAVFFVVPSHSAVLPSGLTVGEWITERKYRSRKLDK